MKLKHVRSFKENTVEAVKEIDEQLKGFDTKFLLYFSSIHHEPALLSSEFANYFKEIDVVGCSSADVMTNGEMVEKGIVAVAFHKEALEDLKVEVLEHIQDDHESKVKNAFLSFEKHFGIPSQELNHNQYVGLILSNGLLNAEESIMETIGSLTNVFFVGGSAADDLKFTRNYVYVNGRHYEDASILVLLQPSIGFDVVKTQSFTPTSSKVVVTKANSSTRMVMELNNRPILEVYAELIGVPKEEVANHFFMNPLGVVTDDDVYIRSPYSVTEEGYLIFACAVLEGMEVHLLENGDIIGETQKAIDNLTADSGDISGIISFNCAYRLLELNAKNLRNEYADIFKDVPTTGMVGYGEDFLGHINQTSTMIVFK